MVLLAEIMIDVTLGDLEREPPTPESKSHGKFVFELGPVVGIVIFGWVLRQPFIPALTAIGVE
jgi:hypothetical protein